jgi:hypothetical protein
MAKKRAGMTIAQELAGGRKAVAAARKKLGIEVKGPTQYAFMILKQFEKLAELPVKVTAQGRYKEASMQYVPPDKNRLDYIFLDLAVVGADRSGRPKVRISRLGGPDEKAYYDDLGRCIDFEPPPLVYTDNPRVIAKLVRRQFKKPGKPFRRIT